jgi:very-short-patch-repair endonuclease
MGAQTVQPSPWGLARRQHGIVTRGQLLAAGVGPKAIKHRVGKGRLHPVVRGVYAVGRPELTRYGVWMAAVLSCGPEAVLSHRSAAELWEIRPARAHPVEVSVPAERAPRRPGLIIHRRAVITSTHCHGIPTTTPADTLIDLAATLTRRQLEAAINEADNHDLIDPDALRAAAADTKRPGVIALRETLDEATFTLTDSELERYFLPVARKAGLPKPQTQAALNSHRVDFYWHDLGLVVETDSLRYHRTATQQAADRRRDQEHAAAGLFPIRFTHWQVSHERDHVQTTLEAIANRLSARTASGPGRRPSRGAPPR